MTAADRKILIIVTSHAELGSSGQRTGYWLDWNVSDLRSFVVR